MDIMWITATVANAGKVVVGVVVGVVGGIALGVGDGVEGVVVGVMVGVLVDVGGENCPVDAMVGDDNGECVGIPAYLSLFLKNVKTIQASFDITTNSLTN